MPFLQSLHDSRVGHRCLDGLDTTVAAPGRMYRQRSALTLAVGSRIISGSGGVLARARHDPTRDSMNQPAPTSPPAFALAEICELADLEPEARELLREEHGPREFLDALLENERYPDAVRFLAHLLPRRQAIFWAWSIARRAAEGEPPPPVKLALEATGRWITEPTEEHRLPMLDIAEAAEIGTPAGCAALAVFFSGGTIAPPAAPPVEPHPTAAAKAIAGSVIFSAVSTEPEKAPEKFRDYVEQGWNIGARLGLWPARE
jgi:hypothetical protein